MILSKLRNYIEPNDLEIHIYKSGIYVVNYKVISSFNSKKIELNGVNEKISVIGDNLVISKLKKSELFISGSIYEVLLR